MTRFGSSDDGPGFVSELVRDMAHLRQQQQGVEARLCRAHEEQNEIRERLDAVENTLRVIGIREGDLKVSNAKSRAEAEGRKQVLVVVGAFLAPLVSWLLIQIFYAVNHARMDDFLNERTNQNPQPMQGPPVPPRLQRSDPLQRPDPSAP